MTGKLLKPINAKVIATALLAVMFFSTTGFAKPISQATAQQVALNFLANEVYYTPGQPLVAVALASATGIYIFSNDNCFVIISADDANDPILAYSTESGFKTTNVSPEVSYMLGGYSQQIKYLVNNNIPATTEINTHWTNLVNNVPAEQKNAVYITNLMKTTWDQAPYYNDMCPYDNNYKQLTVTGCVATAMAQVLKYWNYPSVGIGSNSYDDNAYGTLSVAFNSTTYDWSSMPISLAKSNTAVATLMYDCGVAVDMDYGVAAVGGSAAQVVPYGNSRNPQKCAQTAFVNNFGYDGSTIKGLTRSDFADSTWINMLENELTNKRPIIYAGFDSANEGHCFVFDGYTTKNVVNHNLFHVNWGWSGSFNGYFAITALDPGTGGIGAGTIGAFNFRQQAIIGIQPPPGAITGIETASNAAGTVKIYPNPASDHITADLSGVNGIPQQINFINIQGKLVYSTTPGNNLNNITLNTANLENGMYIMQILSDKGVVNTKVVINR